jgi:2'-5' RNA ligase
MRRLFIAINLPENLKRQIQNIVDEIGSSLNGEARFAPPENWHLTISFLGYQPDEAINPILDSIKNTAQNRAATVNSRSAVFEKIIFGPPNKQPRMIWLTGAGETSKILGVIKNELENNLIKNGVKFQREHRPYNAHLTLARFQAGEVENIKEIKLPQINPLNFEIQSLNLMESHLKRTGAEYEKLAEIDI